MLTQMMKGLTMHKRIFKTFVLVFTLVCFEAAVKAEDYQVPWTQIRDASAHYLEVCVPAKDVAAMQKKLKQRVEQRLQDDENANEDAVMRSIMLDWAASNEGSIKRKEKDAVRQACCYFVIFLDKNYDMPSQIVTQMTRENVKEILDYLEEQIAAVKAAKK